MAEIPLEQLLTRASGLFTDDVAIVGESHDVTYAQLERLALGMAAVLQGQGLKAGDSVALLAPNSVAFVAGFFGAVMSGAVVSTLSPDSTARELLLMLEASAPTHAVVVASWGGRDYRAELESALPQGVHWIEDLDAPPWEASADRSVIVERNPDGPALVAFTSGSTGLPKGVVHRGITLVHAGRMFVEIVLEGHGRMVTPTTFPLYHLAGPTLVMIPSVLCGGKIVMMNGFTVPKLLAAIEAHGIDTLSAVPAMIELLFLRLPEGAAPPALPRLYMAGAPVPNQLVRHATERLGSKVFVAYGQTECPGLPVVTRADTSLEEVGPLVGWPCDGYEIRVCDDQGRPVPDGEQGEVCYSSRFMMLEYLGNPTATRDAIDAEGWLHSGDLGTIRPSDQGLMIQGRKKDMYIRGGFNVYPREVEEALLEHPGVSLAAVHAVADSVLGEKGYAWVVPEVGSELAEDAIRDFLRQRLTYYKLPDFVRIVADLPLSPIGKVDKLTLRSRAEEGLLESGSPSEAIGGR